VKLPKILTAYNMKNYVEANAMGKELVCPCIAATASR
jgi:hypothetical protein